MQERAQKQFNGMKITLLQTDIAWGAPDTNRKRAEVAIRQAPASDLYVLPEMFSTGFATDTKTTPDDQTLGWMTSLARELGAAIGGSICTIDTDGSRRNRFYFVTPDGAEFYDKHHLFGYAGEDKTFAPGQQRVIVQWRGIRFMLQVCYDLRFPIWVRNAADEAEAYDCILYVASWPAARRRAWDILLRARAIENQCYVCGINRIGSDPHTQYSGGTAIIDPEGEVIGRCTDNEAGYVCADIEPELIQRLRKNFPVLRDRD